MRGFARALLGVLFCACGAAGKAASVPGPGQAEQTASSLQTDPVRVVASGSGEALKIDMYDASELFDRAAAELRRGRCNEANELYRKIVAEFPASRFAAPSLYNVGLCAEQLERLEEAANAYGELISSYKASRDFKDALFKLGGVHEKRRDWASASQAFKRLLELDKVLSGQERIEALARLGASLAEQDQREEARAVLGEASTRFRGRIGISPGADPHYYAMAEFHLAAIVHREMREVRLPKEEAAVQAALEHKCQLLLDAQAAYTKVIKVGLAHWAAAAAYRTGSLYRELWEDIVSAPLPQDLDEAARKVYVEVLRQRIRVLLSKAASQWDRTLKMARRLSLSNEWVDQTTRDLQEIRRLLALDEEQGAVPQRE